MRTHPRDDAVKAAFDRFHNSRSPKPAADRQLRSDLTSAGIRPEFKDEEKN